MVVYVRNMVCNRCIAVVKSEFRKAGIEPLTVALGEVNLERKPGASELASINLKLISHGFELINDQKSKLIEKIKSVVIDQIHYVNERPKINFSDLLADRLHRDYTYLSNLFSEIEGLTIEQFVILQKTEKVKELLVYDEMSLSQIADKLGYSSVAYLSSQFKKVTGLTPTHFKTIKNRKRISLDKVKPVKNVKPIKNIITAK